MQEVHAAGCLRDARGYWHMYAHYRSMFGGSGTAPAKLMDALRTAEARIVESFRASYAPEKEHNAEL